MKINNTNVKDFNPYDAFSWSKNIVEIRLIADVMVGEILLVDMENFTLAHLTKMTPIHVKKIFMALEVSVF